MDLQQIKENEATKGQDQLRLYSSFDKILCLSFNRHKTLNRDEGMREYDHGDDDTTPSILCDITMTSLIEKEQRPSSFDVFE